MNSVLRRVERRTEFILFRAWRTSQLGWALPTVPRAAEMLIAFIFVRTNGGQSPPHHATSERAATTRRAGSVSELLPTSRPPFPSLPDATDRHVMSADWSQSAKYYWSLLVTIAYYSSPWAHIQHPALPGGRGESPTHWRSDWSSIDHFVHQVVSRCHEKTHFRRRNSLPLLALKNGPEEREA
jgi:hypothetical protein